MFDGTAAKVLRALEPFGLKPDGEKAFRANSPFRPGSNSQAFTLTLDDSEHGAFFDHVSQEAGSLYELAQRLGFEPERAAVASTKRAYSGIADYAAAHGITVEALQAAGWKETTYQKRPALEFMTATGSRWRFLDGSKPHYKSVNNYQRSWYGLSASTAKKLAEGAALVLNNGEISTVVARQYGIAAACVTGGEKEIPDNLLAELRTFLGEDAPPIIVAFDCDSTGIRAAKNVVGQLREAGFIAKAVDLGLSKAGDLADFCMLHGKNAAKLLTSLPALDLDVEGDNDHPWHIIPASELKHLPPLQWIIDKEIPESSLVVIFGESGAGKSFIGLDYALRVAQDSPVVYIPTEGEWGYAKRVAAWCEHHNKPEGQLTFVFGSVSFYDSQLFALLLDDLIRLRPKMLVVDTLAMAMAGGDENSARDMGVILRACRQIQQALKTTVVLIHHVGKSGANERGSTALRGNADVMIKVSPADDLVLVECSKTKDEAPFEPRYMRLLPVGSSLVPVAAQKVLQQKLGDPITAHQRRLLDVLNLEVNRDGCSFRELQEITGISLGSIQRAMSNLVRLEYVHKPGQSYAITDSGRKLLSPESPESGLNRPGEENPLIESGESGESRESQNDTVNQLSLYSGSPDSPIHAIQFGSPDSPDSAYYRAGL